MKRISLVMALVLLVCGITLVTGCTKKNTKTKDETPAQKIVNVFNDEVKNEKDIEKLAKNINVSVKTITGYDTDVVTLSKKDYVEGFSTEIKGFNKAVAIKPFISGQPFIAYIFEVDDPETFKKTLEDNADLRWNICTMADEYKSSIVDNYVFFVMSKIDFEEE